MSRQEFRSEKASELDREISGISDRYQRMVDPEISFLYSDLHWVGFAKGSWSSGNKIDQDEYIHMKHATTTRLSPSFSTNAFFYFAQKDFCNPNAANSTEVDV